jgi:predicted phosphatase
MNDTTKRTPSRTTSMSNVAAIIASPFTRIRINSIRSSRGRMSHLRKRARRRSTRGLWLRRTLSWSET